MKQDCLQAYLTLKRCLLSSEIVKYFLTASFAFRDFPSLAVEIRAKRAKFCQLRRLWRLYFHRNIPVMPAGTAKTIIGI